MGAEDSAIEISVTDTGLGIDDKQLQTIFEPFTQADGTPARIAGGTGLGLTVSKRLAKLLGGDVTVKSVAGKGSVFTLSLPRSTQAVE